MAVRSTIDFGIAERAMQAAGEELKLRMAQRMADRAWMTAPVDSGEYRSSITVVTPSGGPVNLVSGSVVTAISNGSSGGAVHVAVYAPYALYIEYGHFAGLTWVPPNPVLRNALAETIGAFPEIVNSELFAPFKHGGEWGEIEEGNRGSSTARGPLAGPPA
jgi:hypothetical protein